MKKDISVAAFTGGRFVPSARFRVRQYIEPMRLQGVNVVEYCAPLGKYPPLVKAIRPFWGVATLLTQLPGIVGSYQHDVTLLQREILSTFSTLEPLTKRPRVFDVDDAIWLNGNGRFAEKLARQSDGVICGNSFLAEQFGRWNSNVSIVPTAIDTDRYFPVPGGNSPIIGWSGTSSGYKYLYNIESALTIVLKRFPTAIFRIVSDAMPAFKELPMNRVEFIRWSPVLEVTAIQGMTIGIMPLEDTLWEQGKCSFKMLTYMACGVPVVVSSVGMNNEILRKGDIGLGAKSLVDWVEALSSLLENREKGSEMGRAGRQVVVDNYSVNVISPLLAKLLIHFAGD